ncbi:UNVERIFIED_CONTAM: Retrovirus-related Pol polyprotein from transposon TNT 1-94 [Sesamum angustifolium]|uniref:Retrovirus-related Pol polyprotein from transposon TNT 1-94 n=1 Tax=Sesamum angustifolium TaxID=2727405 RepID=A0AAW2N5D2_9LAMI
MDLQDEAECRWINTKHKARLVAKGYSQLPGIDYTETFAPVARLDTIRALIAIAANKKWKIYQMDVKSAFLNGYIDEEIYVEQPQGFIAKDDLIYTGNNEKMIQDFKEDMMKTFEMSDLGLMHFFLGIEINQEKEGIFICQKEVHGDSTQEVQNGKLQDSYYSFGYWRKVPERRWITKSRWLHVQKSHWKPTISNCHKTRYYVRHKSAIKVYAESEPSTLCSSKKNSKILTRYERFWNMEYFHGLPRKQATVAQSSAEAEYIAAAATSNHAIWLRRILEDMEKQEEPTTIYCDNKSAIAITKNPVQHSRTKHIDIKYHSLREATTRGEIELKYCSTEEQLADIFTKALPRNKFEELRMKIGVCHKHIKGEY